MSINVYEMVTERIIKELEKGNIPWNKPWTGTHEGAYNRISKKPYSLLNQMLLQNRGEYASFKQWQSLGGKVRKGEKAEIVVFWKIQIVEETKEDGTKVEKTIPLLRYYNVFHISQVDGVEPLEAEAFTEHEPIAEAEKIIEAYKTRERLQIIETVSNEAFYSPIGDYIKVPCKEQFTEIEERYSVLFHEICHSTGHPKRLNRLDTSLKASWGSDSYSFEELVAEIGSATLLNILGIETPKTFRNSSAYIQSWLKVLRSDNRFIISASSKAEKALNYILA